MTQIQLPGPGGSTTPKSQTFRDLVRAITNQEIQDITGAPRTKRAMIVEALVQVALHGTAVLPFSKEMAAIAIAQGQVPEPRVVTVNTQQWLDTIKYLTTFAEGSQPAPMKSGDTEEETTVTFERWKERVEFRRRSTKKAEEKTDVVGEKTQSISEEDLWDNEDPYGETS